MANLINTIRGLYEAKDPNEYDKEGEMSKTQLRTMMDAAKELQAMLKDDENMPEWVQSKITKAVDYIDSVRDYMKSNKNSVHTEEMVAKAEKMIAELMESHFKIGQKVKCIASDMTGTVVKTDTPEVGKYYTVKREDGKTMKYAPDELKAVGEVKEEVEVIDEDFEVTEEMIMEAFEQYMIDEGIWDSIKNFFSGNKSTQSTPKADTGSEDNMDNDANTGGVKAGGSYKGVATYADKRDRSPIKTYKLPDSDKLKRQYDAQDKGRAMAKDFTTSVKNIGQTVKDTASKIADKIPQSVKDKYSNTFSTLGKELERRIRKPFSADKGDANPYSSKNFYKDKPEYQKIDQTGYKGISQQKRDLQTKSQLDKMGLKTEPLKQSYEPEIGMSLEESVRAVVLGEEKKPSKDAIHIVLGKTKNAREGLAALKKAFKVDDKEAKKMLDSVMEEVELDEISKETLASYKKKAGEDARKADKEGDFKRGDKRFSGIVKATKKEFDKANEEVEMTEETVSVNAVGNAVSSVFNPNIAAKVMSGMKTGGKKEVTKNQVSSAMTKMGLSPRQVANVLSKLNEEVELDEGKLDKSSPIYKEYEALNKKSVADLRNIVGRSHRVADLKGYDKAGALRQILDDKYGEKKVDAFFGEEFELSEGPLNIPKAGMPKTLKQMMSDYIDKTSDDKLIRLAKVMGKNITVKGNRVIIEETEIDLDEETNMSIKTVEEAKKYGLTQSLLDAVKGVLAADGDVDSKPLDPADPKQAKGKFADRKDKDINNDGKVDKTDKYLHNRRKAVTKAVEKEDEAEQVKGKKAKDAEDVKKGKGTKGAEAVEVNPNMSEASCKTMKEAEMTDAQMKKREEIVKSMKDKKGDFEKRYGDRAKAVMYATATKMAMKEGFELTAEQLAELDESYKVPGNYAAMMLKKRKQANDKAQKSLKDSGHNPSWANSKSKMEEVEIDEAGEVKTRNKTKKNRMDTARGDLYNKRNKLNIGPGDTGHATRQQSMKALGRALRNEEEDVDAMSENEINEAIRHDRYVNAHGKKASGEGNWMFTTAAPGRKSKETFSGKGKLGDVAKNAMKALGSKEVYVMEATVDTADVEKKKNMSSSDKSKLGKIADMLKKERDKRNK